MFEVTDQVPGPVAVRVCCHPGIGFHTLLSTTGPLSVYPSICGSVYGPQLPRAALVDGPGADGEIPGADGDGPGADGDGPGADGEILGADGEDRTAGGEYLDGHG